MKNLYSLLAAGVLMATSAMTAQARFWTYDFLHPVDSYSIETGKWYCLQGGQSAYDGSYNTFLCGETHSQSTNLTTDNLYQFVVAGTAADGSTVYYMKRYDGTYLYAPGQAHYYGEAVDRAWKITVKDLVAYDPDYEFTYTDPETDEDEDYTGMPAYIYEAKANGEPIDLTCATFVDVNSGVVIASADPQDPDDAYSLYTFLCGLGSGSKYGNISRAVNFNNNTWVIYPAEEQSAAASLEAKIYELTNGDMEINLDDYQLGTGAGEYDEDLYNTFMDLWNKALAIYNGEITATDAEIDALAEALEPALDAFRNSGKALSEGYYIIYNCRASCYTETAWPYVSNDKNYDGGAMYDGGAVDPTDNGLRWSLKKDDGVDIYIGTDENQHAIVTDADGNEFDADGNPYIRSYNTAKFVWHASKTGQKDSEGNELFYFQNLETGRYIGYVDAFQTPIKMSDDPTGDYTITSNPYIPGWFCFYSPSLPTGSSDAGAPSVGAYSGIHTERVKNEVVAWDWRIAGSCWKVITVSDEDLAVLRENMDAPQRLNRLQKLVSQAETAIENGYSYAALNADGSRSENAKSGSLALDGLVTDIAQLECPMIESSEGTLDALLDQDKDSYFHSTWSGAWTGDHFLQICLEEAESELLFKWVQRAQNTNGAPNKVTIWGTNDEANLEALEGEDGDQDGWKTLWTEQGTGTFEYLWADAQKNLAKTVGTCRVALKEPCKYIRMAVNTRVTDSDKPNGNRYFHGAEFRLYRSQYDPETSLINAVPEEVLAALNAALAKAKEEIADGEASEETLAELQAAYDAFMEHYPDPTRISDLISEAKALATSAENAEGEGLGYYDLGSVAKLQEVIKAVEAQVKDIMTVDEIRNLVAQLQAALDAFNAAFHIPTTGIYRIKSQSSSIYVVGHYICAVNSSETSNVKLEGRYKDGSEYKDEPNAELRPGQYWYVEQVDGGYTLKNFYTGMYLHPVGKKTDVIAQSTEPYIFALQYAKEPGCFNIVMDKSDAYAGTYIYCNGQPSTHKLVSWYSAEGRDNSAFEFIPQDAATINDLLNNGGMKFSLEVESAPSIFTFPMDMDTFVEDDFGAFYVAKGQNPNTNNIELTLATELKAGYAYVFIPAEGREGSTATFYMPEGTQFTELTPIRTPYEKNGLAGTFEVVELSAGCGIFNTDHSKILLSEEEETVPANTGYFCAGLPATTEKGDATLLANGLVVGAGVNSITSVVVNNRANSGIFTLSGLRLRDTNNLPAGLYIINGKKFIVK